jgi:hypothetical protein
MATAQYSLAPGGALELELVLALAGSDAAALAAAGAFAADFGAAWAAAKDAWEARWLDAFARKDAGAGGGHFSGALPVLLMEPSPAGRAVERAYYVGCLAMLQAERTNLRAFADRTYVTAAGSAVVLGGKYARAQAPPPQPPTSNPPAFSLATPRLPSQQRRGAPSSSSTSGARRPTSGTPASTPALRRCWTPTRSARRCCASTA